VVISPASPQQQLRRRVRAVSRSHAQPRRRLTPRLASLPSRKAKLP
jgi:hypothetical protein